MRNLRGVRDRRRLVTALARWVGLLVGLASVATAVAVVVAPVFVTASTITWPVAGSAPTPTTAFLLPYRPAELHAVVPCSAIRAGQDRPGRTVVLATTTSAASKGLVVRSDDGALQVLLNGREVSVTLPGGDCRLRIDADAAGVAVATGQGAPRVLAGGPVPEVFAITTDLSGADAEGLSLQARTPRWFDGMAAPEKRALIAVQLQLAAVAVAVLLVLGALARQPRPPGTGAVGVALLGGVGRLGGFARAAATRVRAPVRRACRRVLGALLRPRTWLLAGIDVGVVGLLVWWSIVGPLTDDDGFAAVIARNAATTGQVDNYYRWFNASETPFSSAQRVLGLFLDGDLSPVTLRIPSVLAGVAVWLLLTRGLLRPTMPAAASSVLVRMLAALGFAAWWLPYNLGTRPEPLVALGTTLVFALVLRAVAGPTRYRLLLIALAALTAALTVTVAPSGTLTLVPVLVCLPRLWRVLATGSPHAGAAPVAWGALAAHLALILGVAAVAVTVVFSDQSWHGLIVSTAIHDQIGPSQPWYAEWLRYSYLLGDDSWGSATKRVPVLVTIAVAMPMLVLLARRGQRLFPGGDALAVLGAAPLGLVLLAVTPSKWSHHFGSLAGFGALFFAGTIAALLHTAAARSQDRVLPVTGFAAALGVIAAASLSFSGPNAWWGYSNFGLAWSTGPVEPFDEPLRWVVLLALGLLLVVPVVLAIGRRGAGAGPGDGAGGDRSRWWSRWLGAAALAAPAVLTTTAVAVAVAVLVSSFGAVAEVRAGTYSLAGQNQATVAAPGSPAACGIENRIEVLADAGDGPLVPVEGSPGDEKTATLQGFVADGGYQDPPPTQPDKDDGRYVWGSKSDGAATTGSMTSQWFALPTLNEGQELALSVSGRTDDGASVTVEFGRRGSGGSSQPLGQRRIVEPAAPQRGYRGYAADAEQQRLQDQNRDRSPWRTVTVAARDIPADSDRVRILARDQRADDQGWLAVTGPRLVDVVPLRRYLADRSPVLVDWAIAFAFPCRGDYPTVADGVAAAPQAWLTVPPAPSDPITGQLTADRTTPDDIVPERWVNGTSELATSTDTGGSFAGIYQAGTVDEIDTRLVGDPGRVWGRLLVPDYDTLEPDAYDVRTTSTRLSGTDGDPPPVRDPPPLPDNP